MPLEPHRDLILPADETPLWRYMDFAKFIQLLETQSLWFLRVDQFEDPLEGSYTDAEIEHIRSLDGGNAALGPSISIAYQWGPKYMRATAYVNCWREGAGESLAMWDLYGKGSGIIAVKTTVGNLKLAAAESPLRIFLGRVKYLDWNQTSWDNNSLAMCCRKDSSYQHEAEIRAIIWDQDIMGRNMSDALKTARSRNGYANPGSDLFTLHKGDGEHAINVAFAPARFITEIVVGPREKPWVESLVRGVLMRYGLEKMKVTVSNRLTPR